MISLPPLLTPLTPLSFITVDFHWSPKDDHYYPLAAMSQQFSSKTLMTSYSLILSLTFTDSTCSHYLFSPPNNCHCLPKIPKFSKILPPFILSDVHWSFPMTSLTSVNSKVVREQWFPNDSHWFSTEYLYTSTWVFRDPPTGPLTLRIISLIVHCLPTNDYH